MSNRLTFSLASLILILGLVVMPAMAHESTDPGSNNYSFAANHDGQNNATPAQVDLNETNHRHNSPPTVTSITLVNTKTTGASAADNVSGSKVRLLDDVDGTTRVFADGAAAGQFQIKIEFDAAVFDDLASGSNLSTPQSTPISTDLAASDITVTAVEQGKSVPLGVTMIAGETLRLTGDTTNTTFTANISVPAALFGGQTADTAKLPIEVWVQVNANVLYGVDPAIKDGLQYRARANPASSREMFTIVSDLTTKLQPTGGALIPSIPAGEYVVVVRDSSVMVLPTGTRAPTTHIWSGMPDLNALLSGGGTLAVTRLKGKFDHDAKSDTDDVDYGARHILITEVMAAVNTAKTGTDDEIKHQWFELHNPTKADITNIKLADNTGRPALGAADGDVLLDRISNQVGDGWLFTGLGENGSYDGDPDTADTAFASFYRKEAGKDGHTKAHWATSTDTYFTGYKGTPGWEPKTASIIEATKVPRSPFVINEFGIGTNDGDDWIELRNVTEDAQSLENYVLSVVKELDKEEVLFHFHGFKSPGLTDGKVPAKGIVLVTATSPASTDIAAGKDISDKPGDQVNTGVNSLYVVRSFELPSGQFNLILRKEYDSTKSGDFFPGKKLDKVVDAIGSKTLTKNTDKVDTGFWPLNRAGAPHDDVIEGKGRDFKEGHVYIRKNAGGGTGEHHLGQVGYTGIGYDRKAKASNENGGTPGYDNGALTVFDKASNHKDYLGEAPVTISEIMYHSERNVPQWIELYNSSMTQAVQLDEWRLKLENGDDVPIRTNVTVKLASKVIQPKQTVLIVAFHATRNSDGQFPSDRIIDIWRAGLKDKDRLEIEDGTSRTMFTFLSKKSFKVTLMDKAGNPIDTVGNMGADPAWELPAMSDDGVRASLLRRYNPGNTTSGTGMAQDGTMGLTKGWTVAMAQDTYYGNQNDMGSPGYRIGGPLPVSLSKFRPERLKDTGEIVIRWITESELNNAGFNILRSETRNGEFIKINTKLIAGQGTTSERTTYTWKDTTAKPTVVYYYQIQDVSLDGQVQTLRTTQPSER